MVNGSDWLFGTIHFDSLTAYCGTVYPVSLSPMFFSTECGLWFIQMPKTWSKKPSVLRKEYMVCPFPLLWIFNSFASFKRRTPIFCNRRLDSYFIHQQDQCRRFCSDSWITLTDRRKVLFLFTDKHFSRICE